MACNDEHIAIIGSACRFPGGSSSPAKLWELLREPRDVLRPVPSNRWDAKAYYHPDPTHKGTSNVQSTYFLDEDVTVFDNWFFQIQSAEATSMDPQQRILLETVYDSLCDAGLTIESLRGSPTSVFVGQMCDDWNILLNKDWDTTPTYAATGNARSISANRISYFFDWRGPSMTIDTACSSSLVAVHQAVQTLINGESRVALAAGSNLILSPNVYIAGSNLHMLSPRNQCHMWDAGADGYGRGEGVAAILMKPLSAALADGDNIECIIRATAVNQDGRTPGLTMPSSRAQAELIRSTYARAGLDINSPKDRPQFFHAHGTGTMAGDTQEAEAITLALFQNGNPSAKKDKLLVGSVKTIIGHTEGTAGLASIIASIQALRHGVIPPNMLFNRLNPGIEPFSEYLEVPTTAREWPDVSPGEPRRVSINSFGIGGTNAHAILESFERPPRLPVSSASPHIIPFVFSAASEFCLLEFLRKYLEFLGLNPDVNLRDLSWTLHTRRSLLAFRVAITASCVNDLYAKIKSFLHSALLPNASLALRYSDKKDARVWGVFTGQGAQWPRMGAGLVEASELVREYIAQLDQSLQTLSVSDRPAWNIKDELLAHSRDSRLSEAEISQPLCTAVQVVLVNLLRLAGIKLHCVIGHSSGEIGAAYASGLISAADAIRIAYYRGKFAALSKQLNEGKRGAMLAVGTTLEEAEETCELERFYGKIQVAAHNSPSSIILSGDEEAIDDALGFFGNRQTFVQKLKVDTAYHSHHMLPCAKSYVEALDILQVDKPTIDGPIWYSSVAPPTVMTRENLTSQYWAKNMTSPVQFFTAVANVVEADGPPDLVLEFGPHPALKGPFRSCLEDLVSNKSAPPHYGLLSRGQDDLDQLSSTLGEVWKHLGVGSVDFDILDQGFSGDSVTKQMITNLPQYPFDHSRSFNSLSRTSTAHIHTHSAPHPLLGRRCVDTDTTHEVKWRNHMRPTEISWISSHQLQGQLILPATAYIAMAIDSIISLAEKTVVLINIEDIVFERAIVFSNEEASVESLFTIRITKSDISKMVAEFACYSNVSNDTPMVRNTYGRITAELEKSSSVESLPDVPMSSFNLRDVKADRFYSSLAKLGYEYRTPFNCIRSIKRKLGYATGRIYDMSGSGWEDQMILHPGMMDSALQTISTACSCPGDGSSFSINVPTHIERLIFNPCRISIDLGKQRDIQYTSVARESFRGETSADVYLSIGGSTEPFAQFEGVHIKPLSPSSAEDDETVFSEFVYGRYELDGKLAVMNDKLDPMDIERAEDLERVAYFYMRRLLEAISPEERSATLPHYQQLLAWVARVDASVILGENPTVCSERREDTRDVIAGLLAKWSDDGEAHRLKEAGENMITAIRNRSSISKSLSEDTCSRESRADQITRGWLARLACQFTHRYPRVRILEIGAGTGELTEVILPALDATFSSYTYTDVSSEGFRAAEARFRHHSNRMAFKVFDVEKLPNLQGFTDGSYDLIVAFNILHATSKVEEALANLRRLLKPGGYLLTSEIISNDVLRLGLPLTGHPKWWIGAEADRPWVPNLTLSQWERLLRNKGFSGIDTVTPQLHHLYPCVVFATQAVDERISLLRNPLCDPVTHIVGFETLTIIGGKTTGVKSIVEGLISTLQPRCKQLACIDSVDQLNDHNLPDGSSVICVTELDEPLLKNLTPKSLKALKVLWRHAGNILWVSKGARSHEPYSSMMVGLSRTIRTEYSNINLQILDIETLDEATVPMISKIFLRLQIWEFWVRERSQGDMLWSVERELVIEQGQMLIPRLYPKRRSNLRYNTARRMVSIDLNPQKVSIHLGHNRSSTIRVPVLQEIPHLRIPSCTLSTTTTIQITHSIFPFIRIEGVGSVMLCAGVDNSTNSPVFALSCAAENPAPTISPWTVHQFDSNMDPARGIASVAAYLLAHQIIAFAPGYGTLVVHETDPVLAQALLYCAKSKSVQLLLTTSRRDRDKHAAYIILHPRLSKGVVMTLIPEDTSAFVNLAEAQAGTEANDSSGLLHSCLPQNCVIAYRSRFYSSTVQVLQTNISQKGKIALQNAVEESINLNAVLEIPNILPLSAISTMTEPTLFPVILAWNVPSVSVELLAIDEGTIFKANKTYLLVGLTGELGQSLAQWMVQRGARYIVLTSRRPKVDPQFIEFLTKKSAVVRVLEIDVTNHKAVHTCLDEIHRTMPPVGGVANGAMVLRDSTFENMNFDDWVTCVGPKVEGTRILDDIFHDTPLDFFIAFSSLAAVVGNIGQSNYAAANAFMTALCVQRKRRGVAGSAMDMSSIVGLGLVERSRVVDAGYFTDLGVRNLSETDFHQLFAEAVAAGRPDCSDAPEIVTGIMPMSSEQDMRANITVDPRFGHFMVERPELTAEPNNKTTTTLLRVLLLGAETFQQVQDIIRESFTARLKQTLRMDEVHSDIPLVDIGLDSLMSVELRNWFTRELDVKIPIMRILSNGTANSLVRYAAERQRIVDVDINKRPSKGYEVPPRPTTSVSTKLAYTALQSLPTQNTVTPAQNGPRRSTVQTLSTYSTLLPF